MSSVSSASDQPSNSLGVTAGEWVVKPVKISISAAVYREVFAVHQKMGDPLAYVITHIPSGFNFCAATGDFDDATEAMETAEIIFAAWDDWASLDYTDKPTMRRLSKAIRSALAPAAPPASDAPQNIAEECK